MGTVAIIGAGPAGLAAAEQLAKGRHQVTVFDRMSSPARKFLLAGRGGLNITHSEPIDRFHARYGVAAPWLAPALHEFPPDALVAWCNALGQPTFVGSSGRVFPTAMKAAPLLRAWLGRLDGLGVRLALRHRWVGWTPRGLLKFETAEGEIDISPDVTLLALGGGSWPRMGSDGGWVSILRERGVCVASLRPANCGIIVPWTATFIARFEGMPLKRISVSVTGQTVSGEALITRHGLEGGAIYALSTAIRAALDADGAATLLIDLRPDMSTATLAARVDLPRGSKSLSNFLRTSCNLSKVSIGLVQEASRAFPARLQLSELIKALPVRVVGLQTLERAISSAGGIIREEVNDGLMLSRLPGVFAAGEMLDWEAPTGGYLLQGCFSTGIRAAQGIEAYLSSHAGS